MIENSDVVGFKEDLKNKFKYIGFEIDDIYEYGMDTSDNDKTDKIDKTDDVRQYRNSRYFCPETPILTIM